MSDVFTEISEQGIEIDPAILAQLSAVAKGGPGSGNFEHEGRPGLVGGSSHRDDTPEMDALSGWENRAAGYFYDYVNVKTGDVNPYLRGKKEMTPEARQRLDDMARYFDKTAKIAEKDMVLYRGIGRTFADELVGKNPEELVGKEIVDKGYSSTAWKSRVAEGHALDYQTPNNVGIVLAVTIPKGTKHIVVNLSDFGDERYEDEDEHILSPGRYQITSYQGKEIKENGRVLYKYNAVYKTLD
jgi:hypothetical protein